MTTFNDWIEKAWRRVNSGTAESTVQLNAAVDAVSTEIFVTPINSTAMRVGARLSVDMEVMYVTSWNAGTGEAYVIRGYEGSTAAAHANNALVYIQPKYTRFDIGVALNDELARLSSPDQGLFQVKHQDITFNPVYMGYDLTQAVNDNFIDIMEVRYKIPFPTRNYPGIHRWKVLRSIGDTTTFPSGAGIVFYEGGYPGQPVYVQYSAPFTQVDVSTANLNSDVRTLTGMTATMLDIPPLGVEIQLTLPREIRRNFMEFQPDPRKAPEVPSMAVSNSVQALTVLYNQRVSEEAGRLSRQYTRVEGW